MPKPANGRGAWQGLSTPGYAMSTDNFEFITLPSVLLLEGPILRNLTGAVSEHGRTIIPKWKMVRE